MLFSDQEADEFNKIMSEVGDTKKQDSKALGKITSLLKPVVDRYSDLDLDKRNKARDTMLKFTRAYGFITQLVRIDDKELFKDYLFVSHLFRLLPRNKVDIIDITDKIKLEYASLKESFKGAIILDKQAGEVKPQGFKPSITKQKKVDVLSRIVDKVNDRYGEGLSEADKVALTSVSNMLMDDPEIKKNLTRYAQDNNPDMFIKSIFPEKFNQILVQCYLSNDEAFKKLMENQEFQKSVMNIMAQEFYKELREK